MRVFLSRLVPAVLVAAVTGWLYLPVGGFDFVNFDDGEYVYENRTVQGGLTAAGVRWAFTNTDAANWHPLTWLSLMADVSLFGTGPGPIHAVNAGLHAVAAGMFFLFLVMLLEGRLAGTFALQPTRSPGSAGSPGSGAAVWAAAFGALLWALHPLRVESVAWISSRKDVLSVLFCLGGLLAHLGDVRAWRGGASRETGRKVLDAAGFRSCTWRYWVALGCFALGYMAKPTMMVFPAFVALTEWLETGRVRWKPLALFGACAVAFLGVTVFAQTGAITEVIAPRDRLMNVAVSVAVYLRQFVWPAGLSVFYPYNLPLKVAVVGAGLVVVAGCSAVGLACWRRVPVVTFGLAWFAAALVPVLGFIQVGSASHADRYTYLATLGFSVAVAYGVCGLVRRCGRGGVWTILLVAATGAVVCTAEGLTTREYLGVWRGTRELFEHAARVTEKNGLAHTALGNLYAKRPGQEQRAALHWRAALAATRNAETLANVAFWMLLQDGSARREEAGALAREALSLDAQEKMAACALGLYHLQRQEWAQAEAFLRAGLDHFRDNPMVWEWLAMCCANQKKNEAALAAVAQAEKLNPGNPRYRMMMEQLRARQPQGMGPRAMR